jgi:hypothetical protein
MFLHPFRLFSMFAFEGRIDASWLLLAVLISLDARRRFLPQRHPRADNGDLLVDGSPCDHRLARLNRISRDGTFARRPPLRHADPRHQLFIFGVTIVGPVSGELLRLPTSKQAH